MVPSNDVMCQVSGQPLDSTSGAAAGHAPTHTAWQVAHIGKVSQKV